jgi:dephospho-CoA kinase
MAEPAGALSMLRVGLTGGIATGKSYVRARFEALGLPTVDADLLARQVVERGTHGLAALVARFGPEVLGPDGSLDRSRLGARVFADAAARRDLEVIIHPRVFTAISEWFDARAGEGLALGVADIPLLFETGRAGDFDVVVVAACPPEVQVTRVQARDGLSETAARQRLAAQWPIDEKVRLADYVVRTDRSFADTDRQAEEVCRALRAHAARA